MAQSDNRSNMTIKGDNPIKYAEDDSLGRLESAQAFARQVLSLDASEGAVVGVLGAWGSGKTSFINLARSEFEKSGAIILDFNPWMFSGAEQLVERFFAELSAQLKMRKGFSEVAKNIVEYGEAISNLSWVPIIGTWIERLQGIFKIISKVLIQREEDIGTRRVRLEKVLRKLDHPIIVVLDDIDRLSSSEIREVFKLVRLTASFPNIIYAMAFDRSRIEEALSEQKVPGRAYLEKILQVAVDLPTVAPEVINRQILVAIDNAISDIKNPGPFDDQIWPDVFMEIIQPLIRNMRDIRRYAASVYGSVIALEGQIALADVLALEAIRVFLPDVYSQLPNAIDGLTKTSNFSSGGGSEPSHLKTSIDSLIKADEEHQQIVKAMIYRLFPAGERHIGGSHYGPEWKSQWIRERRVAHEDIFRLYLERVAGEGLRAFTDAEKAFSVMHNQTEFEKYLRSLKIERLEDVISSLENFEDKYSMEHVQPGVTVLLNLLPELPNRPRGMFLFDSRTIVKRVVFRLLRSLNDPVHVETVVKTILPKLKSLSTKLDLITQVGHHEGAGHKFVSEQVATDLEKKWRSEVRKANVAALEKESDLLRVLLVAKKYTANGEPALKIANTPKLTLAILQNARQETISQQAGNRAVRRLPRLQWDSLTALFDGSDALESRINKLKTSKIKVDDELMNLVDRYLRGWRPNQFDDD
jgi:predicted KAP-like P-loop ATPase